MPTDTDHGFYDIFDDFSNATIGTSSVTTGYRWISTSDTGDTAFAVTGAAATGSSARATTAATNNNMVELAHGLLPFRAQDGEMHCEVRVQLDAITNVRLCVGFSNRAPETSNNPPITYSGTTWTTNASTAACWVFDTAATTANWHCFWVNADTDASLTNSAASTPPNTTSNAGFAPVAATYETLGVHIYDMGSGNTARLVFTRNGREYKTMAATIARTSLQTVGVWMQAASGTAHQVDVDYIHIWGSRS